MSTLLAMLIAAAADHRVVFTHYEVRDPTAAQLAAYESGDRGKLAKLLPVTDRLELRIANGETERFSSGKFDGYASLEVDGMGYLLRFDSGRFEHKSPMLLQKCEPRMFYAVLAKAGDKRKITAQQVSAGC